MVNGLPSSFVHKSNNICNERKWPLFRQIRFLYFLTIFFFRQVKNHTKPEIETPNFGGYAMLAKISYIQRNDLFLSELLDNSFFFLQNKKYLLISNTSKVMIFFPNPLKNVFSTFANIASKETDFFQKWDLYMNDDCYQRKVLRLSYKYLY